MRIVPLSVRIGAPAAGTVSLRAGLRVGAATRIIHGIDGLRIGLSLQQPLVTRGTRRAILYRGAGLAFERMSGAGRKKNPKRHDMKDHSHGVLPFFAGRQRPDRTPRPEPKLDCPILSRKAPHSAAELPPARDDAPFPGCGRVADRLESAASLREIYAV